MRPISPTAARRLSPARSWRCWRRSRGPAAAAGARRRGRSWGSAGRGAAPSSGPPARMAASGRAWSMARARGSRSFRSSRPPTPTPPRARSGRSTSTCRPSSRRRCWPPPTCRPRPRARWPRRSRRCATPGPPAPTPIRSETRAGVAPVPVLRLFGLVLRRRHGRWGMGASVTLPALRLAFDYGGRRVAAFPYGDPRFREGDTVVTVVRDRAGEERAHRRIALPGTERADALDHLGPGADASPLDRVFDDDGPRPGGLRPRLRRRGGAAPARRGLAGRDRPRAGPAASTRAPRRSVRAWRPRATAARAGCRSA